MKNKNNIAFIDTAILNDETFIDYKYRLEKIARNIFEWVNLPSSMDSDFLEKTLYFFGQAAIYKNKDYGIINTKCNNNDTINIYDNPSKLNCFNALFQEDRICYNGFTNDELNEDNCCILVKNNNDRIPTANTLDLFAYRLYEAERTIDVNIKRSKISKNSTYR